MAIPATSKLITNPAARAAGPTVQVWLCDVCKVRSFLHYDDAVEHENSCRGSAVGPTVHEKQDSRGEDASKSTHISCAASQSTASGLDKGKSKTARRPPLKKPNTHSFFAPRSSSSNSEGGVASKRSQMGQSVEQVQPNPFFAAKRKVSPSNSCDSAIRTSAMQVDPPERDETKAANTPTQSDKVRQRTKRRKDSPSRRKGGDDRAEPMVVSDNGIKESNRQPTGRTKQPRTERSETDNATQKPKRGRAPLAVTAGPASKKNNPTARVRRLADMIDNDLKASPKLASIFQNKSSQRILAEQRQAELQARQDSERQRERERQAKRALVFGAGNGDRTESKVEHCHLKPPGKPFTDETCDTGCRTNNDYPATLPQAPRFPVPNHVLNELHPHNDVSPRLANSTPISTSRPSFQIGNRDLVEKPNADLRYDPSDSCTTDQVRWLSSPSALDVHDEPSRTLVQQVLSELVVPATTRTTHSDRHEDQPTEKEHSLWSEKYGMRHGLVGAANQKVFQSMVEYLNNWRVARKESLERMAERQRKLQGKRKKRKSAPKPTKKKRIRGHEDSDSEDDWLFDDDALDDDDYALDDPEKMATLCLLTGPPSSGKTALVHHVARHCHCSVLEVNTTRLRSGSALKCAIEEATQSCSSLEMLKMTEENKFYIQKKATYQSSNRVYEEDEQRNDTAVDRNRKNPSMTIVLIDEIDILFGNEGDAGFWSALASVAKSAKCPIILTANHRPEQLSANSNLRHRHFETERPTSMECATKLLQILQSEGIQINPSVRSQGPEIVHEALSSVATACECDLRKMMLELQVMVCRTTSQDSNAKESVPSNGGREGIMGPKGRQPSLQPGVGTQSNDWCPIVEAVVPTKVPMDTYSIVHVKGRNFSTFGAILGSQGVDAGDGSVFSVWIGDQRCQSRLVDDATISILCPPYNDRRKTVPSLRSMLRTRVVPLAIECPSLGMFKSRTPRRVKAQSLVDGTATSGAFWLTVEYEFPGKSSIEEDAIEQSEINLTMHKSHKGVLSKGPSISECNMEDDGAAVELWRNANGQSTPGMFGNHMSRYERTQKDLDVAAVLEKHAIDAHNSSDAALMEDFQQGVPFLAGACKGFGFDYTDGWVGKIAESAIRMHDNSRP
jgi:DNA polymerase III delta prime subunit